MLETIWFNFCELWHICGRFYNQVNFISTKWCPHLLLILHLWLRKIYSFIVVNLCVASAPTRNIVIIKPQVHEFCNSWYIFFQCARYFAFLFQFFLSINFSCNTSLCTVDFSTERPLCFVSFVLFSSHYVVSLIFLLLTPKKTIYIH